MMKRFKHILAIVLAVLLLLTACGTVPQDPTSTEPTKATEATEYIPPFATRPVETYPDPATTDMKINCQYLPETVDNPDNLPVLKWVCLPDYYEGYRYGCVWNEAAVIEVNQMLAERNMPFRVQFAIYSSDYYYKNMDWFVRPEAQADITSADLLTVSTIQSERAEDYYMPLTEYARGIAMPSLKNAVPHEINWQNSSANGEVYGISQKLRYATSSGWRVDPDVLDEYGLTVADFQKDYWEMDETLKKLNETSGKRQLIEIASNSSFIKNTNPITQLESIYPGITANPMLEYSKGIGSVFAVENNNGFPTVVNMLDTETTHRILNAVIRYRDQYAAPDSATAKFCFYYVLGDKAFRNIKTTKGTDYWEIPASTSSYNASESASLLNCSGISASSKCQKEAITLLNLIAEDEEFRMHLMFGKEGRDYTFDIKGNYCVTKQEDGSIYNMSFLSPWSHFSGMKSVEARYAGTDGYLPQYDGMTILETYQEMVENAEPYYAVPFDFSGLQEEVKAVEQVCQLYFYRFASLSEEKYAEMIEKINAAGGEKIMAELQKQLDEWVKNNPGKRVTPRQ